MKTTTDIVIIGSGPAGMAAALYASRAGRETIIIEKFYPGGQAFQTFHIENYPGIKSIDGPGLSEIMSEQATSFGAKLLIQEVKTLDLKANPKKIWFRNGDELEAKAVILAMGAQPKRLETPGELEFTGKGVSYCATCDGAFYRGKEIAVVGGGDSALEESMFLTRFASKVTIVHRRNEFRATQIIQDRIQKEAKVSFMTPFVVKEVIGEEKMTGLQLINRETQEEVFLPAAGVFVYVGYAPQTELVEGQVELDHGYIVANETNLETSIPGVFAAGDLRVKNLRQVVTAVADGAIAAVSADHWLDQQEA